MTQNILVVLCVCVVTLQLRSRGRLSTIEGRVRKGPPMLHLTVAVSLFCAASTPQAAAPEAPVIKAELKDVPAQGKGKPSLLCEGTSNLPDGAYLNAYI